LQIIFTNYVNGKKKIREEPESIEGTKFHAVLSFIKALTSEWSFKGIHECRKICGGLGYSSVNRLG
jgi:hypothetical protein